MHSPAASIPSVNDPLCVPSEEKLTKNRLISGTATTIEGEPVPLIGGIVKVLEHVSEECLKPEVDIRERRQVYACNCAKENQDEPDPFPGVDEELCYGKKFRPEEIPAYTCKEFGAKDVEAPEDDECGCGDLIPCLPEETESLPGIF